MALLWPLFYFFFWCSTQWVVQHIFKQNTIRVYAPVTIQMEQLTIDHLVRILTQTVLATENRIVIGDIELIWKTKINFQSWNRYIAFEYFLHLHYWPVCCSLCPLICPQRDTIHRFVVIGIKMEIFMPEPFVHFQIQVGPVLEVLIVAMNSIRINFWYKA